MSMVEHVVPWTLRPLLSPAVVLETDLPPAAVVSCHVCAFYVFAVAPLGKPTAIEGSFVRLNVSYDPVPCSKDQCVSRKRVEPFNIADNTFMLAYVAVP